MSIKIAILGDFRPGHATHMALNRSLEHVRGCFGKKIQFDWIDTDKMNAARAFDRQYNGLWIAPGSPYKDMQNVLGTISYARQRNIPAFGNCGGFQHMIIEFARNVCGIAGAGHEETNPDSGELLISRLSCSLVGKEEELTLTGTGSTLSGIIRKDKFVVKYSCNFGLNANYLAILESNGLKFTAISPDGQFRAFELPGHPFFLGTLFQPALTSTMDEPHPLNTAYSLDRFTAGALIDEHGAAAVAH